MGKLIVILQTTVVLLWILETKLVRCELWVAKPLTKALWGFSPSPVNNTLCREQSSIYKQNLANLTLWAIQMLDASTLAPNGLVAGDIHQLGHFDSCMATRGPVQPQFCVPTIMFQPFSKIFPTFDDGNYSRGFEGDDNTTWSLQIWEKMKPNPDASKQRRDRLHWGLCLPASCRPLEIQTELNETLNSLSAESHIHFQVSLSDLMCYNPHKEFSDRYTGPEKSAGFYIMCYLLAILGVILVIATVTDILLGVGRTQGDDSSTRKMNDTYKKSLFLQLYSVRLNLERLTRKDKSSEFDILNGMKFVLLFFVVTGHRGLFNMGTALSDPEYVESLSQNSTTEEVEVAEEVAKEEEEEERD
ncbi:uncharacterized protein LOC120352981 [Nilaparvata lugens]|uniref:uncharacterized protein LOC120352981 n=1 Tax=Nilaparvata lugens TaxID=108931 RepID=UPI00193E2CC2|nr:uncharacterized protein LOC120352981 [Nilaparvata lugens]